MAFCWSYRPGSLALLLVLLIWANLPAQLTDERVRKSMNDGVRFLLSKQEKNGSWHDGDYAGYPTGVTSLCTLALLNAGMTADDPEIAKALNYLRKQPQLQRTYTVALQTIVYCTAGKKVDLPQIQLNVHWLEAAQRKTFGDIKGSWGYSKDKVMSADPSNAQFALLALYEADRAGLKVKDSTWRLALDYWHRTQRANGSFGYRGDQASTGSMTCAGIGSLIIASGQVNKLDAQVNEKGIQCCASPDDEDDSIERALEWLGKHFSVRRNPTAKRVEGLPGMYHYYYLYALERVGRLAGQRFIGDHDWYREGVEELLGMQDELEGYWNPGDRLTCTAFSVLFLSKGRRPILMAKIKRLPDEDWNHHRHDVAHLTRYIEKLPNWKQDLTWQVVDLANATADDLLQSPVLFISGRDALEVVQEEKDALKTYIEMGGFVFAENCCDGDGFDRDFRALMKELFPESELGLLPKDHAIWFAEQRVPAQFQRPLEGLEACCRTGVVYCPENISCYWELATPKRDSTKDLPARVVAEMKACLAIGANVVTYATGRELRQKLDQTDLVLSAQSTATQDRATLYIAKLEHNGGSDDAPSALSNVLSVIEQQTQLSVSAEKRLLSAVDPKLPDYPIAFLHGRRAFRWSGAERKAIRRYIDNGGVIFADAICAEDRFAESFRREMQAIFPNRRFERVPPQHAMFTDEFHGHDLQTVTLRDPRSRTRSNDPLSVRTEKIRPLLEGIEIDGRYVVMFSPHDMSCALENRPSLECRSYTREDAAKLATNIVLYAMQQ